MVELDVGALAAAVLFRIIDLVDDLEETSCPKVEGARATAFTDTTGAREVKAGRDEACNSHRRVEADIEPLRLDFII